MRPFHGRNYCRLVLLRRTLLSYKAQGDCALGASMNRMIQFVCTVAVVVWPYAASAQAWAPWSLPNYPQLVGVQFVHDDGGALTVLCDRSKHLISYILREPRANWQEGSTIEVKTRADDGTELSPSPGHVLKNDTLTVLEESTWDISTMGKAKVFFAMGAGGYARIFPLQNFKALMEPVLQACGDHW